MSSIKSGASPMTRRTVATRAASSATEPAPHLSFTAR